jgi:hypothetical protein
MPILPILFYNSSLVISTVCRHWSQSYVTTGGQSASLSCCQAPIWGLRRDFYYCQRVAGLLMWDAFSGERTGLPFTIAAGLRQRSNSQIRVLRDLWPYFTVSDSTLPQPREPYPHIYIPQEEGGPVIPPGTGLPFRRLLRLAGLRWRYLNTPPHGRLPTLHQIVPCRYSTDCSAYNISARTV